RLRRRCDAVGGQARHRRQGHLAADSRARRHSRPDRQPDLHHAALFPPDDLLGPAPMNLARLAFLTLMARPLAGFLTGADVIGREHLPTGGPAIIAANDTSHVDTLLLLTIFPARLMGRLRPVAAADYFLRGPLIGWFSRTL